MCKHDSGFSKIQWMKYKWVWVCNLNCGYFSEYPPEEDCYALSKGRAGTVQDQAVHSFAEDAECPEDVREGVLGKGDLLPDGCVSTSLLESKKSA
jgi:hypothetical protein